MSWEPSPQGVFLAVSLNVFVGMRTGPFTFTFFSLAPLIQSAQTFSRDFTLWLVSVIRIWCIVTSGSKGVFPVSEAQLPDRLVPQLQWTVVVRTEQTGGSSAARTTRSQKGDFVLFYFELGSHHIVQVGFVLTHFCFSLLSSWSHSSESNQRWLLLLNWIF